MRMKGSGCVGIWVMSRAIDHFTSLIATRFEIVCLEDSISR